MVSSRPRYTFAQTARISDEREILIDGFDALLASLCGRGEIRRLSSELDRPGVGRAARR